MADIFDTINLQGEEYTTPPAPWLPGYEWMKNIYTDPFSTPLPPPPEKRKVKR